MAKKQKPTKATTIERLIKLVKDHPGSFPETEFDPKGFQALVKQWDDYSKLVEDFKALKTEYKKKREHLAELSIDLEDSLKPLKKFVKKESKLFDSLQKPPKKGRPAAQKAKAE